MVEIGENLIDMIGLAIVALMLILIVYIIAKN